MKSRKRLWILVGLLGAVVSAALYLARPEDELATVKRFQPLIYRQNRVVDKDDPGDPGQTVFLFRGSAGDVKALLPGLNVAPGGHCPFPMPAGRVATISRLGKKGLPGPTEEWSIVVEGDSRPWYESASARVRQRIGL